MIVHQMKYNVAHSKKMAIWIEAALLGGAGKGRNLVFWLYAEKKAVLEMCGSRRAWVC